jgi:hypothetical protein
VDLVDRPLYLDRIEPFIDAPVVKVITGLRRSGKSRLLELVAQRLRDRGIADGRIVHLNFDSRRCFENGWVTRAQLDKRPTMPRRYTEMAGLAKFLYGTRGKISAGILATATSQLMTAQQIDSQGIISDQLQDYLQRAGRRRRLRPLARPGEAWPDRREGVHRCS